VTLEEIRTTLHRGAALPIPHFTRETSSRERVDALEQCLNLTAVIRGDLGARLYAQGSVHDLGREWEEIVGWEAHLRRRRADVTQREITAAKAEIRADLHAALREARSVVARLSE
jgi:hypothetical protein